MFKQLFTVFIALSLVLMAPPAQAGRDQLKLSASATTAPVGTKILLKGHVGKSGNRAKVTLERRQESSSWAAVKTTRVSARRTFGFAVKAREGRYLYRAVIAKTKRTKRSVSRSIAITGRKRSTPPSTTEKVIQRILDETNEFRARHGQPALILSTPMNTVAGNYAKRMHDTCTFEHNPDYSSQIPDGWTRAGENIAAGYPYTEVVTGWINSPGHRANILGDFTHIGIGYYQGPKCYDRYYVQNFAKY